MKHTLIKYFSAALLLIYAFACGTTEPGDGNREVISLSVIDAASIEAWLKVTAPAGSRIIVQKDGNEHKNFTLTTGDTTLHETGLTPAQTYTYTAYLLEDGKPKALTPETRLTTMDTTTHDFTFLTYSFGGEPGYGFAEFNDVAIISENEIWAVGDITVPDTSQDDGMTDYNLAIWKNGNWEMHRLMNNGRILFPDSDIDSLYGRADLIHAFNENEIWVFAANIIKWNGSNWSQQRLGHSFERECMWASDTNNVYLGGSNGTIVHYDGNSWEKLETGTDKRINDIYGIYDQMSGEYLIYALACNLFTGTKTEILLINKGIITKISSNGLHETGGYRGIWLSSSSYVITTGIGVYSNKFRQTDWQNITPDIPNYFIHSISGENNNLIIAGSYFLIAHFNGISWKHQWNDLPSLDGRLRRIKIKSNTIAAVGTVNQKAYAVIGN